MNKPWKKYGLEPYSLITEAASSFTLGGKQLRKILEERPETNGIFCTNDDLAIGALFECQRLGIAVLNRLQLQGSMDMT